MVHPAKYQHKKLQRYLHSFRQRMCIVFMCQGLQDYQLILCANRDEYLDRPTAHIEWWNDWIVGGRDLAAQEGYSSSTIQSDEKMKTNASHIDGTCMAMHRDGRFGFVTNYREKPGELKTESISRGSLVRDYLQSDDPDKVISQILDQQQRMNGFNLVLGSVLDKCVLISNRNAHCTPLEKGKNYGICNGDFHGKTWPKVERGQQLFDAILSQVTESTKEQDLIEQLVQMLRDEQDFEEEHLPMVLDRQFEKALAPIYLDRSRFPKGGYGTRTHTVILVKNNHVWYHEVTIYDKNYQKINRPETIEFDLLV
ncbi:NRDE protein-domain-containing protein [Gorgonomyces haynaldii]|nr:NRDE protein-domain-containing protein [Gorgonomyces haynaldii]